MAQMYQQYDRQQVTHVADDPAQVANHPISTISGLEHDQAKIQQEVKRSTVKITEIVDKEEGKL